MNRAACFGCRMRASSTSPTTVITCACGYTSSYCRRCGGQKRAQSEYEAHREDCISARRRSASNRKARALGTTIHLPDGSSFHKPGKPDDGKEWV